MATVVTWSVGRVTPRRLREGVMRVEIELVDRLRHHTQHTHVDLDLETEEGNPVPDEALAAFIAELRANIEGAHR